MMRLGVVRFHLPGDSIHTFPDSSAGIKAMVQQIAKIFPEVLTMKRDMQVIDGYTFVILFDTYEQLNNGITYIRKTYEGKLPPLPVSLGEFTMGELEQAYKNFGKKKEEEEVTVNGLDALAADIICEKMLHPFRLKLIEEKIDAALLKGDRDQFNELSQLYKAEMEEA